jgi:hypothetical protein
MPIVQFLQVLFGECIKLTQLGQSLNFGIDCRKQVFRHAQQATAFPLGPHSLQHQLSLSAEV